MTATQGPRQNDGLTVMIQELCREMKLMKIKVNELEINGVSGTEKKFKPKRPSQKKRPMIRGPPSANDMSKLLHLKEALRLNTDDFIENLTVSDGELLDRLYEEDIINEVDYHSIASRGTDIEKVRLMLVKIKDSSPENIEGFLNVLAKEEAYKYLTVKVNQSLKQIQSEDSGKAVCVVCVMKSTVDINDIVDHLYRDNIISDELYSDIVNQQGLIYCFKEFIWKEIIDEVQRTNEKGLCLLKEALDTKYKHIVTSLDKLPIKSLPDCCCMKRRAKRPRPKDDPYDSSTDRSTTSTVARGDIQRQDSMTDTEPESSARTVIANETLTTDIETDIEFTADSKPRDAQSITSTGSHTSMEINVEPMTLQDRIDLGWAEQSSAHLENNPTINTKPGSVQAWNNITTALAASEKNNTRSPRSSLYVEASTSPIEKLSPENLLTKVTRVTSSTVKGHSQDTDTTKVSTQQQEVTGNKSLLNRSQLLKYESADSQMKRVRSLPEMKSIKNGRTKRYRSPSRRQRAPNLKTPHKDSTSGNSTSDSESDTTIVSVVTVKHVGAPDSRQTNGMNEHTTHAVHPEASFGSEPTVTSPESDHADPLSSLPSKPQLITDRMRSFAERRPSDGLIFSKSESILENLTGRPRSNSGTVRKLPVSASHQYKTTKKAPELVTRTDSRTTTKPIAIPKTRSSNVNEAAHVNNTPPNIDWVVGSPESETDKVTSPDEISINIDSSSRQPVTNRTLEQDSKTTNLQRSDSLQATLKRTQSLPPGMFQYDSTRKRKLPTTKSRTPREPKPLLNQNNHNRQQIKTHIESSQGGDRLGISSVRSQSDIVADYGSLQNNADATGQHAFSGLTSGVERPSSQHTEAGFTSLEDNFLPVRNTKDPYFFANDKKPHEIFVHGVDQGQVTSVNKGMETRPSTTTERLRAPVKRTQSLPRRRHKSPSSVTRATGAVKGGQEGVFHPVISHQPKFNFSHTNSKAENDDQVSFV